MSKLVGFVSALVLLVVVFFLVNALMNTVDENSLDGQVVEKPESKEATETAKAESTGGSSASGEASSGDDSGSDAGGGSGDIAAGKQKFASCAACHGADGKGQGGAFPALTGLDALKVQKALVAYRDGDKDYLKSVGLGDRYSTMAPNAANLSDDDIANVAVYIADSFGGSNGGGADDSAEAAKDDDKAGDAKQAESKKAPAEPKMVSESSVSHGAAVYSSCAICHGEQGEGGALFNAPKLAGMGMDQVASLLKIYRKGQEMGPNSYAMIPQAKHLTDGDIQGLAAYIATFEAGE